MLEIVQRGILHLEERLGLQRGRIEIRGHLQHTACVGAASKQPFQRTLVHYPAAFHSGTGTHVHDVVRDTDHLLVVLDEQDRIAVVTELADRVLEQGDVVVVQADAGLVEDIEQVGEGRVDVLGYLASLGLAAGERTHRTVQVQVS